MIAAPRIRALSEADIPALARVLARAYGSEQNFESRLHSYLRMERVATFVADLGGVTVGMVVGNDYGPVAYVSQMAVDPHLQRRGIGTRLMDGLIAWIDERGFAGTELDATPSGAPLYRRYGFSEAGKTVLYSSSPARSVPTARETSVVRTYMPGDEAALFAADRHAFGADRSDVLRLLFAARENATYVFEQGGAAAGYAVAQIGAGRLGPIIAPTPSAAAELLDAARTRLRSQHQLTISADNAQIDPLLVLRGYRPLRTLAHMVRGTAPAAARDRLYARINLGQG